jgi:hypothetical protein
MAWAGQYVTVNGKKYVVSEQCPEEGCSGTIRCTGGGGFDDYMKVSCDKCGAGNTGYSFDAFM